VIGEPSPGGPRMARPRH